MARIGAHTVVVGMAKLIMKDNFRKRYKGTVVGPVHRELFVSCIFEDCLILECHTCRFDGCTFRRCSTTSFTESVITLCNFQDTDLRTGMACLVQDSLIDQSNITDESMARFQSIDTAGLYSIRNEYESFVGFGCSILRNRVSGGVINLQGSGHAIVDNFVDDPKPDLATTTALTNGAIQA